MHIAYCINKELYFLCVSTTVTFHTIKLNCYLAKLRQVVFSRCYAPNSLKASQAIVFTVEIQCEWVGTLTNDQQWIRRDFPKKTLHFKCLLHCDRQATEKPKIYEIYSDIGGIFKRHFVMTVMYGFSYCSDFCPQVPSAKCLVRKWPKWQTRRWWKISTFFWRRLANCL